MKNDTYIDMWRGDSASLALAVTAAAEGLSEATQIETGDHQSGMGDESASSSRGMSSNWRTLQER